MRQQQQQQQQEDDEDTAEDEGRLLPVTMNILHGVLQQREEVGLLFYVNTQIKET